MCKLCKSVFVLICALLMSASALLGEKILVDRVVATVNDQPILHSEVQERIAIGSKEVLLSSYPVDTAAEEASDALRVTQDLINIHLAAQSLLAYGIDISDREVNKQLNSWLASQSLTHKDLSSYLLARGQTFAQHRDFFRYQFIVQKFISTIIMPSIKITDEDLQVYFLQKTGNALVDLHIEQLVVDKTDEASKIYRELQAGLDFRAALELYHDKSQETALPPVKLQDLSSDIRKHMLDLKVGEVTPPVQVEDGTQRIFYLKDKKIKAKEELSSHKEQLSSELLQLKLQERIRLWLEKQRRQAGVMLR